MIYCYLNTLKDYYKKLFKTFFFNNKSLIKF